MQTNELVIYVQLQIRPERIDAWRDAFQTIADAMAQEDAFIACHLHRDATDPTLFTLYERWAEPSVEAFLQNQMKPYRVAYEAALVDMLQRPRQAQVLEPLAAWSRSAG